MGRSRVKSGDWESRLWNRYPRYREALSYVAGQHCFGCVEGTCHNGPGAHAVNPAAHRGWPISVECPRGHALRRIGLDCDHNWHPYPSVIEADEKLRPGDAWGIANILPADRRPQLAGHVCEEAGCSALLRATDGPWCEQHEPPLYAMRHIEEGHPEEGHSLDGTGINQTAWRTRARCHRCTHNGVYTNALMVGLYALALETGVSCMRLPS